MRISQQSEHMIGILVYCGMAGETWVLSSEAADSVPMSRIYAAKMVNALSNAGLIATRRGRHGGIRLAKAPEAISLGDVMRLAETAPFSSTRKIDTIRAGKAISHILRSAEARLEEIFDAFSLADLLDGDAIPDIVADHRIFRTCPFAEVRTAPGEGCHRLRRLADAGARPQQYN